MPLTKLVRSNSSVLDRVFWLTLIGLSSIQLLILIYSPLNLDPDEAHYWDWSRSLDLAYYSKGPVVALLISASRFVWGEGEFAVRFPAWCCLLASSVLFYFTARYLFGAFPALIAFLSLRCMLIFQSQGFAMTTDPPAALFWLIALSASSLAIKRDDPRWWIPAFLSIGVGLLAKYTVAFLAPSILLFLLLTPGVRRHLFSAPLIFGLGLMALCLLPILIWNANNGWVNFAHNATHLGVSSPSSLQWRYFPELIAGQLGLAGPVVLFSLFVASARAFRAWVSGEKLCGLFVFSSLPLLALCVVVSFIRPVYANWPMPIYLGASLAFAWAIKATSENRFFRPKLWSWGILINLFISLIGYGASLGFSWGLPGSILPTKKMVGWEELGEKLGPLLEKHREVTGRELYIIAGHYGTASALGFYTEGNPRAYCGVLGDRRMNQFDVWNAWEELEGEDALVVIKSGEQVEPLLSQFESLELIEPSPYHQVHHHGAHIRDFSLYFGHHFSGQAPSRLERR